MEVIQSPEEFFASIEKIKGEGYTLDMKRRLLVKLFNAWRRNLIVLKATSTERDSLKDKLLAYNYMTSNFREFLKEHIILWELTREEFITGVPAFFWMQLGLVFAQKYKADSGTQELEYAFGDWSWPDYLKSVEKARARQPDYVGGRPKKGDHGGSFYRASFYDSCWGRDDTSSQHHTLPREKRRSENIATTRSTLQPYSEPTYNDGDMIYGEDQTFEGDSQSSNSLSNPETLDWKTTPIQGDDLDLPSLAWETTPIQGDELDPQTLTWEARPTESSPLTLESLSWEALEAMLDEEIHEYQHVDGESGTDQGEKSFPENQGSSGM
jgi:hypothetical protein